MDDLEIIFETLEESKKVPKPTGTELSQKQLALHHDDLYEGYLKKYREVRSRLSKADRPSSNHNFSQYRSLRKSEAFLANAVRLHELYFKNIGSKSGMPIEFKAFVHKNATHRIDEWSRDIRACAMASRGWVIFGHDNYENKCRCQIMDDHWSGNICCVMPIIVLDTYEHAYMIDFGVDKKKYINWFLDHIDWSEVMYRIDKYGIGKTIVG